MGMLLVEFRSNLVYHQGLASQHVLTKLNKEINKQIIKLAGVFGTGLKMNKS